MWPFSKPKAKRNEETNVITIVAGSIYAHSTKYGYGILSPNTRNDGDRYDCYVIIAGIEHTASAYQCNGIRYAYPSIYDFAVFQSYVKAQPYSFPKQPTEEQTDDNRP